MSTTKFHGATALSLHYDCVHTIHIVAVLWVRLHLEFLEEKTEMVALLTCNLSSMCTDYRTIYAGKLQ